MTVSFDPVPRPELDKWQGQPEDGEQPLSPSERERFIVWAGVISPEQLIFELVQPQFPGVHEILRKEEQYRQHLILYGHENLSRLEVMAERRARNLNLEQQAKDPMLRALETQIALARQRLEHGIPS